MEEQQILRRVSFCYTRLRGSSGATLSHLAPPVSSTPCTKPRYARWINDVIVEATGFSPGIAVTHEDIQEVNPRSDPHFLSDCNNYIYIVIHIYLLCGLSSYFHRKPSGSSMAHIPGQPLTAVVVSLGLTLFLSINVIQWESYCSTSGQKWPENSFNVRLWMSWSNLLGGRGTLINVS